MNVSIIIPVFNEIESIPKLCEELRPACEEFAPYEVICIDDGSTDGSFEALEKHKQDWPELKAVRFAENAGKAAALYVGFQKAKGDIMVTIDADLQEHPSEIKKLLNAIHGHDAAFGWRHNRHDSFFKNMASRFANGFRNCFLHDNSHDSACSLKAFKGHIAKELPMFKGFHRFFPALLKMHGYNFVEVKIDHQPRQYGKSKYSTFGRAIPTFFDLWAVVWISKRRLKYKVEKTI